MALYHILIVMISSVIPENMVLLTKSEQFGPKSAHIPPLFPFPLERPPRRLIALVIILPDMAF